jgi:DNA-binding NtrC family response regulator
MFVTEVAELNKTEQKGLLLLISRADKYGVKVVCSTTQALNQLAAENQFDEHLLQALSVATLRIPSLQDHPEDIPDLARAIATLMVETNQAAYREFDIAALNALRNAEWPGNLAQLDSAVRNLMQTSLGEKITLADVNRVMEQFELMEQPLPNGNGSEKTKPSFDFDKPLREARDEFERLYFEYHLAQAAGNMSKVAELVQLERTHLYRKLKQLGIKTK